MLTMAPEERRVAFGNALDDALGAREVTQREIAEQLGTTQSAVSAWVNAQAVPDADVVFQIERMLNLPPGYLSQNLGFLPPGIDEAPCTFDRAVAEDHDLTEEQKDSLRAMYRHYITTRSRERRRRKR